MHKCDRCGRNSDSTRCEMCVFISRIQDSNRDHVEDLKRAFGLAPAPEQPEPATSTEDGGEASGLVVTTIRTLQLRSGAQSAEVLLKGSTRQQWQAELLSKSEATQLRDALTAFVGDGSPEESLADFLDRARPYFKQRQPKPVAEPADESKPTAEVIAEREFADQHEELIVIDGEAYCIDVLHNKSTRKLTRAEARCLMFDWAYASTEVMSATQAIDA